MAKFWYYTIHRCPDCGATYDEYDHTAPWCDSGLSSSPVREERCPECWEEFTRQDREDEAVEMIESAIKYLADETYPDWSVVAPIHLLNDCKDKILGKIK